MSIASELTRIQTAKSNLRQSIINKGGTVASDALLGAYATAVDNLPSGGGDMPANLSAYELDDWGRPSSLTIKSGVTGFPEKAFQYCDSLTSVTLSNTVTSIGRYVFDNSGLKSLTIPGNVQTIGIHSFSDCKSLSSLTINSGVTTIDNISFSGCSSLQNLVVPDTVTYIGSSSFKGCSSLTSVTIGSGVTSIGNSAFTSCSTLSTITSYATTAPTLGGSVFNRLSATGVLTIPQGSDYTTWIAALPTGWTVSYIVPKKARLILSDSTVVDIPEDGNSDFGWADIQSYTSTVVEMDIYPVVTGSITIGGCTNLTTLNLPNSITAITSEAFYGCSALTSLTIPDSVTVIGDSAFMECSSLTSLTIPSGVTSIDGWCFMSCSSITDIYCYATTAPTINNQTFRDIATGGTLHYPTGSDYSSWMSNEENYLGYFGWTSVGDI